MNIKEQTAKYLCKKALKHNLLVIKRYLKKRAGVLQYRLKLAKPVQALKRRSDFGSDLLYTYYKNQRNQQLRLQMNAVKAGKDRPGWGGSFGHNLKQQAKLTGYTLGGWINSAFGDQQTHLNILKRKQLFADDIGLSWFGPRAGANLAAGGTVLLGTALGAKAAPLALKGMSWAAKSKGIIPGIIRTSVAKTVLDPVALLPTALALKYYSNIKDPVLRLKAVLAWRNGYISKGLRFASDIGSSVIGFGPSSLALSAKSLTGKAGQGALIYGLSLYDALKNKGPGMTFTRLLLANNPLLYKYLKRDAEGNVLPETIAEINNKKNKLSSPVYNTLMPFTSGKSLDIYDINGRARSYTAWNSKYGKNPLMLLKLFLLLDKIPLLQRTELQKNQYDFLKQTAVDLLRYNGNSISQGVNTYDVYDDPNISMSDKMKAWLATTYGRLTNNNYFLQGAINKGQKIFTLFKQMQATQDPALRVKLFDNWKNQQKEMSGTEKVIAQNMITPDAMKNVVTNLTPKSIDLTTEVLKGKKIFDDISLILGYLKAENLILQAVYDGTIQQALQNIKQLLLNSKDKTATGYKLLALKNLTGGRGSKLILNIASKLIWLQCKNDPSKLPDAIDLYLRNNGMSLAGVFISLIPLLLIGGILGGGNTDQRLRSSSNVPLFAIG